MSQRELVGTRAIGSLPSTMPLTRSTTIGPAHYSSAERHAALVQHGATLLHAIFCTLCTNGGPVKREDPLSARHKTPLVMSCARAGGVSQSKQRLSLRIY